VTLAVEAGANVKELQTLARHSTPNLTMNVYARNRNERLSELAEKIGESVLFEPECAKSVHSQSVEAHNVPAKFLAGNELERIRGNGGGGIRTPVPRCFKTSVYMLSRSIEISPSQAPSDRLSGRLFRLSFTSSARMIDKAKPADWRPYQTRRHGLTGRVAYLGCHTQL